jgi:hypothetical protein
MSVWYFLTIASSTSRANFRVTTPSLPQSVVVLTCPRHIKVFLKVQLIEGNGAELGRVVSQSPSETSVLSAGQRHQ